MHRLHVLTHIPRRSESQKNRESRRMTPIHRPQRRREMVNRRLRAQSNAHPFWRRELAFIPRRVRLHAADRVFSNDDWYSARTENSMVETQDAAQQAIHRSARNRQQSSITV